MTGNGGDSTSPQERESERTDGLALEDRGSRQTR